MRGVARALGQQKWQGARLLLCVAMCGALATACQRTTGARQAASDGGAVVGGGGPADPERARDGGSTVDEASPDVLVWASELAVRQGDMGSARRLIALALARLGAGLQLQPVLGLMDATSALSTVGRAGDAAAGVVSDFASNGSVLAVAHGGLLSVMDLRRAYQIGRLAQHPATIRQVDVSADGRRVATFADDQILRLFALPTGVLLREIPLSLDFLALGERPHASLFSFSPDSRRLFALDCGDRVGAGCPMVRLRVFDTAQGERHSEILPPGEPVDYTSRSDGTVTVLVAGQAPRFYDAGSGMEWPLPTGEAAVAGGAAACQAGRYSPVRGRSWLISPERGYALTLASPSLLCLWDLREHRLSKALALGRGLASPMLLSLLMDGRTAVLAEGRVPASGGAATLPDSAELFDLQGVQGGKRRPRLPFPLSVLPLDEGGALWTAAARVGDDVRGTICLLPARDASSSAAPSGGRCLTVPGLWTGIDRRYGPTTVSGDGRFALFSAPAPLSNSGDSDGEHDDDETDEGDEGAVAGGRAGGEGEAAAGRPTQPVLVDLATARGGMGGALPRVLPLGPASRVEIDNADVLADGRLITIDAMGGVRGYSLPSGEPRYATPPAPPGIVGLAPQGEDVLIALSDGGVLRFSPARVELHWAAVQATAVDGGDSHGAGGGRTLVGPGVELTGDAGGALWISDRRTSGRRVRLQLVTTAGTGHPPGAIAVATDGKFEVLGPLGAADLEPYLVCRAGPYQAPLPLCEERLRQPGLVAGFVSGLGPGSLRAVLNPAAGGGASLPSLGPGVRVQPRQHPTPMGAMPQRRRGGAAAPKLRLSGGTGRSGAAAGQVEP